MGRPTEGEKVRAKKEPCVQVTLGRHMGERKILNISLLARELGMPRYTVESLVKGKARQIRLDDLARICCYFGCAPGDLLVLKDCCN